MSFTPKISIITVVYNDAQGLETTLQSVANQSYKNIEYIVVDGASKDNTLEVIKKNEAKISIWKSEPDKGIYDAMNKGLALATGDYVWFMNAGDVIYNNETLSDIFKTCEANADVYYGETQEINMAGEAIGLRRLKTPEQLNWLSFKRGMLVSHQSILIKKSFCKNYDTQYKISADIDWVIYALRKSKKIVNTKLILSKFEVGGMSRQNIKTGLQERFKIMVKHYGFFSTALNHIPIAFNFFSYLIKNKRF